MGVSKLIPPAALVDRCIATRLGPDLAEPVGLHGTNQLGIAGKRGNLPRSLVSKNPTFILRTYTKQTSFLVLKSL
jgi:hypothetical protein